MPLIKNYGSDKDPSMEDILASIRRILAEDEEEEVALAAAVTDERAGRDEKWKALLEELNDHDESAGTVRESTSVLNQDEIDSLLHFDEEEMTKPLTADETPAAWSFKSDAVAKKFEDHVREQLVESVLLLCRAIDRLI